MVSFFSEISCRRKLSSIKLRLMGWGGVVALQRRTQNTMDEIQPCRTRWFKCGQSNEAATMTRRHGIHRKNTWQAYQTLWWSQELILSADWSGRNTIRFDVFIIILACW